RRAEVPLRQGENHSIVAQTRLQQRRAGRLSRRDRSRLAIASALLFLCGGGEVISRAPDTEPERILAPGLRRRARRVRHAAPSAALHAFDPWSGAPRFSAGA